MAQIHQLGKAGEKEAQRYLIQKGYQILETNWRFKRYEVDIIATTEQFLVFCEVKTRSSDRHGSPAEAVNKRKQEFLLDAAEAYLDENNLDNELRFDIISIVIQNNKTTIEHIEDAFIDDV